MMIDTTPSLRKRTKPLTTAMFSEATVEENQLSSQLPSPLSSIDENNAAAAEQPGAPSMRYPRRRRSSASAKGIKKARSASILEEGPTSDSQWVDIPLAVAIIPLLGTFLTGGDFLRDFLLFILLLFYLHQLIKLPWELYLASRPRGRRISRLDTSPEQENLHNLAESELRTAEFCYLTLSVLAPLIGASLLRYVGTALTGKDYISWFSTGVFVLITGIRPWRHLAHRLRSRTEELHDAVSALREDRPDDIPSRMARLEEEITQLKAEVATKRDVMTLNKDFDESLDVLDATVGKHEREAELVRRIAEERFAALEKAVNEALREVRSASHNFVSPRTFFEWIRPQTLSLSKTPLATSPHRAIRPGYRPRLASVREEEDGGIQNRARTRILSSKARARRSAGQVWLDMLLFPFSVGRALLWGILDFLQRGLV